jgi:MutS domain V
MYPDEDFFLGGSRIKYATDLIQDLRLETLLHAMAGNDDFIFSVAKDAMLASLQKPHLISYRQRILVDCMNCPDVVRALYEMAVDAIEGERKVWGWVSGTYPEGTLHRCRDVLDLFVNQLKKLKRAGEEYRGSFKSEGFGRFFDMLARELDDEYILLAEEHLRRLSFRDGTLMEARLGDGNKGTHYTLLKPPGEGPSWFQRLRFGLEQWVNSSQPDLTYEVHDRDEAGYRALSDLKSRGISSIAVALAQSTDHILSFFSALRRELAFYLGCINLRDQLLQKGEPLCIPQPMPANSEMLTTQGLYDACLSLGIPERCVGNDIEAENVSVVMITGANRGGKSTLLRSIGLAQLMMQSGMFVPATSFRSSICSGIFTHFKREEDALMKSGKFDEELGRMSAVVDELTPYSMLLLNESFASTNEREGSEIARQIVSTLKEVHVRVCYVTHMFTLAQSLYRSDGNVLFLRAERLSDGQRTFKLNVGEPFPTSFGQDLYARIFCQK